MAAQVMACELTSLQSLLVDHEEISCVHASPTGVLVLGTTLGRVHVATIEGTFITSLPIHRYAVEHVRLSVRGVVVSADIRGGLACWEWRGGREVEYEWGGGGRVETRVLVEDWERRRGAGRGKSDGGVRDRGRKDGEVAPEMSSAESERRRRSEGAGPSASSRSSPRTSLSPPPPQQQQLPPPPLVPSSTLLGDAKPLAALLPSETFSLVSGTLFLSFHEGSLIRRARGTYFGFNDTIIYTPPPPQPPPSLFSPTTSNGIDPALSSPSSPSFPASSFPSSPPSSSILNNTSTSNPSSFSSSSSAASLLSSPSLSRIATQLYNYRNHLLFAAGDTIQVFSLANSRPTARFHPSHHPSTRHSHSLSQPLPPSPTRLVAGSKAPSFSSSISSSSSVPTGSPSVPNDGASITTNTNTAANRFSTSFSQSHTHSIPSSPSFSTVGALPPSLSSSSASSAPHHSHSHHAIAPNTPVIFTVSGDTLIAAWGPLLYLCDMQTLDTCPFHVLKMVLLDVPVLSVAFVGGLVVAALDEPQKEFANGGKAIKRNTARLSEEIRGRLSLGEEEEGYMVAETEEGNENGDLSESRASRASKRLSESLDSRRGHAIGDARGESDVRNRIGEGRGDGLDKCAGHTVVLLDRARLRLVDVVPLPQAVEFGRIMLSGTTLHLADHTHAIVCGPRSAVCLRVPKVSEQVATLVVEQRFPEAMHVVSSVPHREHAVIEVADMHACHLWGLGCYREAMAVWGENVLPWAPAAYWDKFLMNLAVADKLDLIVKWLPFNDRGKVSAAVYERLLLHPLKMGMWQRFLSRVAKWPVLYSADRICQVVCNILLDGEGLSLDALARGESTSTGATVDANSAAANGGDGSAAAAAAVGSEAGGACAMRKVGQARRHLLLLTAMYKLYEFGNRFLEAAQILVLCRLLIGGQADVDTIEEEPLDDEAHAFAMRAALSDILKADAFRYFSSHDLWDLVWQPLETARDGTPRALSSAAGRSAANTPELRHGSVGAQHVASRFRKSAAGGVGAPSESREVRSVSLFTVPPSLASGLPLPLSQPEPSVLPDSSNTDTAPFVAPTELSQPKKISLSPILRRSANLNDTDISRASRAEVEGEDEDDPEVECSTKGMHGEDDPRSSLPVPASVGEQLLPSNIAKLQEVAPDHRAIPELLSCDANSKHCEHDSSLALPLTAMVACARRRRLLLSLLYRCDGPKLLQVMQEKSGNFRLAEEAKVAVEMCV